MRLPATEFLVEYRHGGDWCFRAVVREEEDAVRLSRAIWKDPQVSGVRIISVRKEILKEALKKNSL